MELKLSTVILIILTGCFSNQVSSLNTTTRETRNAGFGIFSVVRFPNDICGSTANFNGTCFSESECTTKGGISSGTCASGFGVCCVFNMACGSTVAQNISYHSISSFNSANHANPCKYTICPCGSNICKLRLDFQTFSIAGPPTVTSATATASKGPAVGDCDVDSFTVTVPGGRSPPVVCGLNTGQHMFLDSSSLCNILSFNIDSGITRTRSWTIKVTQYECGNPAIETNDDCLQYYTGTSGSFSSFNYDTTVSNAAMTTANTHLANQNYNVCFRQERGFCSICFSPATNPGSSFSISASAAPGAAQSGADSVCSGAPGAKADYIEVMNLAPAATVSTLLNGINRVCGNFFNANGQTTSTTLCSAHVPFRWGVHFDDGEAVAASAGVLDTAENADGGGMIGFNMNWFLKAC